MSSITHLFYSLEGSWHFQRTICNGAKVEGIALFKKLADNVLHYREDGTLTMGDERTFSCYQEYIYRLEAEGIKIFFNENPLRHFHTLEFAQDNLQCATGDHLCKTDHYAMTYLFETPKAFRLHHKVKGEKKDYQMTTLFLKCETT